MYCLQIYLYVILENHKLLFKDASALKLLIICSSLIVPESNKQQQRFNKFRVIASASFKMLNVEHYYFLSEEETMNSFLIPFKFSEAFIIAFFIFFLDTEFFSSSAVSSVLALFVLIITKYTVHLFQCSTLGCCWKMRKSQVG